MSVDVLVGLVVGVSVGLVVPVSVGDVVGVSVGVVVGVSVGLMVGVLVIVEVLVDVVVTVDVLVGEGVSVGVRVGVGVRVLVGRSPTVVGECVGIWVGDGVEVRVRVGNGVVGVRVGIRVGVAVGPSLTAVRVGDLVGIGSAPLAAVAPSPAQVVKRPPSAPVPMRSNENTRERAKITLGRTTRQFNGCSSQVATDPAVRSSVVKLSSRMAGQSLFRLAEIGTIQHSSTGEAGDPEGAWRRRFALESWEQLSLPAGAPRNVAQAYARLAVSITAGKQFEPDFAHAVKRHSLIEAIERSSAEGRSVRVPEVLSPA